MVDYRQWYAVFVVTGQEEKVRVLIENRLSKYSSIQAKLFVPRRLMRERKNGIVGEENRIMFPGYVLVGTDDIERIFDIAIGLKGVLKFLQNGDEFQKIRLEEISRLVYMADNDDLIGESEICFDKDDQIVVLSGPLKGEEGRITKLNRRKGRVAVEFDIGAERHEIWLSVRLARVTSQR